MAKRGVFYWTAIVCFPPVASYVLLWLLYLSFVGVGGGALTMSLGTGLVCACAVAEYADRRASEILRLPPRVVFRIGLIAEGIAVLASWPVFSLTLHVLEQMGYKVGWS